MTTRKSSSQHHRPVHPVRRARGGATLVLDTEGLRSNRLPKKGPKPQAGVAKLISGIALSKRFVREGRYTSLARQRSSSVVLADWAAEVADDGEGYIVLRTKSGTRRLLVQDVSYTRDFLETEVERDPEHQADPAMDTSVAEAVMRARERGQETAAGILDRDDMLSGEAIGELMGMTRQAVDKARKTGKLLGLEGAKRGVRYPAWQLDEAGRRRTGLLEVLDLLGNDWDSYRFFMWEHDGITNRDLLARSEADELMRRARLWASGNYA